MRITLLFIMLILCGEVSFAAEPNYNVDVRFLFDQSRIIPGSAAESDAYNIDSGTLAAHPTFATNAVLQLGGRRVRVSLIASRHDDAADVSFVKQKLLELSVNTNATLFVEQGDPFAEEGSYNLLRRIAEQRAPELLPALQRASRKLNSELNPQVAAELVFAQVARAWRANGGSGRVVNLDLASNYSEEAIVFLRAQARPQLAAQFLRLYLQNDIFSFAEFRGFLSKGFPAEFPAPELAPIKDCCANSGAWVKTFLASNQFHDLVRERYMRSKLMREAKDGDVIVAHPVHLRHLLEEEKRI